MDVFRTLGSQSMLVVAASALSQGLTSVNDIERVAQECRGLGIRIPDYLSQLLALIPFPAQMESALEAIFFADATLGHNLNLISQAQYTIQGQRVRVDFKVDGHMILIELDGRGKYGESPEEQMFNFEQEKRRADLLYSLDSARIFRFGFSQVLSGEAARIVAQAVAEANRGFR